MQYARRDICAHIKTGYFDIVYRKVFRACQNIVLGAGYERHAHGTGMVSIFGIGFLGASPAGVPQQVNRRCQQYVATPRRNLTPNCHADTTLKSDVKCGRSGNSDWKCGSIAGSSTSGAINHFEWGYIQIIVFTGIVEPIDCLRLQSADLIDFLS